MLNFTLVCACFAFMAVAGLFAQPANPPAFEVASVKPSSPKTVFIGVFTHPGGRITIENYTLLMLMEEAFSVHPFQISGGTGWIHEIRYNIEAKPPASSLSSKVNPPYSKAPPNDEQRQMLRTLLADRFKLVYHRETKEGPVYLLSKGNQNLKLSEAKNKEAFPWVGSINNGILSGNGIAGINASMQLLAARLSPHLGRPVLDQTGLVGSFDFKFEYVSEEPRPDVISSILTSVKGLGLKLEAVKGPVETIVIDHIEKPSEN